MDVFTQKDVKLLICKETTIQVDASGRGLGAVLTQNGKLIAFASKSLIETEQRYANIERELLTVVFGCERFHTHVYGKHFTVESNHKPFEMIQQKSLITALPSVFSQVKDTSITTSNMWYFLPPIYLWCY